ncbi:MAG: UMP kinase [Planctomycetes bacterium]|jgi:uridylate kinase|nr:UMP kinase [Planctomycetota bacterium]
MPTTFILSLGGSLIAPTSGVDWQFLKKFRRLILDQARSGKKFFIITGGGTTCRAYQQAALKVALISRQERDWVGIHLTHFHAHFLRILFGPDAHPAIITDPTKKQFLKKNIILGAGWQPGCSTDKDAVLLAKTYNIKTIINLTNIDYTYNKDPRKFKDAKKLVNVSWPAFRKIVGNKWLPGLNAPFDPVASRLAAQIGLKVVILNGHNLINLKHCLAGKKFKGTTIN